MSFIHSAIGIVADGKVTGLNATIGAGLPLISTEKSAEARPDTGRRFSSRTDTSS
jgi:hypothetical protein